MISVGKQSERTGQLCQESEPMIVNPHNIHRCGDNFFVRATYQAEALATDNVSIEVVLFDPWSRSSEGKYLCNRHGWIVDLLLLLVNWFRF